MRKLGFLQLMLVCKQLFMFPYYFILNKGNTPSPVGLLRAWAEHLAGAQLTYPQVTPRCARVARSAWVAGHSGRTQEGGLPPDPLERRL